MNAYVASRLWGVISAGLTPAEEGADVVEGANPLGAECHDHAPMNLLAPRFMLTSRWKPASRSCSLLIGQR